MTGCLADYDSALDVLRRHGQEHLLRFRGELTAEQQARFLGELAGIDWATLAGWIKHYVLDLAEEPVPSGIEPASYYPVAPRTAEEAAEYEAARERGRELLRAGRVAGFTVAGGQGTRLGYDAPKGTFPISPVKGKSLFELFAESILRAQRKYDTTIPWYILTSPTNDAATREFFEEHDTFGLDAANVSCFMQGTLPAIGPDGKLLLADKGALALSPNGHGGSLLALRDSGALDDMASRGVDHVSYWQVDNPLVQPFDLLFLGLHDSLGSEMSCRSLTKTGPFEKLGNFCVVDGKLLIIEYSDMPDDLAQALDEEGRLRFRAGSPAIHILSREFVERLTAGGTLQLPLHRAHKKVSFVDAAGQAVTPAEPNAYKLEMFIFDALPLARQTLILEAVREENFGPVKNQHGVDSIDSCRALLSGRALKWLRDAGVPVAAAAAAAGEPIVELSPRRFLDPEDVAAAGASVGLQEISPGEYYA